MRYLMMKKCKWCGVRSHERYHKHCKKAYHRGKIEGSFTQKEIDDIKSTLKMIDGAYQ